MRKLICAIIIALLVGILFVGCTPETTETKPLATNAVPSLNQPNSDESKPEVNTEAPHNSAEAQTTNAPDAAGTEAVPSSENLVNSEAAPYTNAAPLETVEEYTVEIDGGVVIGG